MERKSWVLLIVAVGFIVVLFYAGVFTYIGEVTGLVVGRRSCVDPDGYLTIQEQAFTANNVEEIRTYNKQTGSKVVSRIFPDKCNNMKTGVVEYYCDGPKAASLKIDCENGCKLGACNPEF